jgi:hypothetical protein
MLEEIRQQPEALERTLSAELRGVEKFASSEKFVGDGERQRAVSRRNLRNFRHVESNDLC